jgi:hypothetical protein
MRDLSQSQRCEFEFFPVISLSGREFVRVAVVPGDTEDVLK